MGELPLHLRRQLLSSKYRQKIERHPNHPLIKHIEPCWQFEYLKGKNVGKPFGYRLQCKIGKESMEKISPSAFPPWLFCTPMISTELSSQLKKSDHPIQLQQQSLELIHTKWSNQLHIYTDGSKVPDKGISSAAFYVPHFSIYQGKRLSNFTSSYRAELAAIILALEWVEDINIYTGVIIFSDSLSGLLSLQRQNDEPFITEILTITTKLKYKGIDIYFEWIPGHCGVIGNEIADACAKAALSNKIEICNKLTLSEIKQLILQSSKILWQERWNQSNSALKELHPSVTSQYICNVGRQQETTLHRLRVGVVGLNQDLLRLGIHPTGFCDRCHEIETVRHYLIDCPKYIIERAMLLSELNESESGQIMEYLKKRDPGIQKAILRFVSRTKRFNQGNGN